MDETPILRQLLICEKIIFEQGTGNPTLINCHSGKIAAGFPADPVPFVVYGLLTDGFGAFTMQLRVLRLDTLDVIFQHSMPMVMMDRLQDAHFVYRMNNLSFPIPGRYEIDLSANGSLIGLTTFSIRERSANES